MFGNSVNAVVDGVDVQLDLKPIPEWTIGLQASYAHDKVLTPVTCNIDLGIDPVTGLRIFNTGVNNAPLFPTQPLPDLRPTAPDGEISFCPGSTGHATTNPAWNATVTSRYTHPLNDHINGFVQGLLTYYPTERPPYAAELAVLRPRYALGTSLRGSAVQTAAGRSSSSPRTFSTPPGCSVRPSARRLRRPSPHSRRSPNSPNRALPRRRRAIAPPSR